MANLILYGAQNMTNNKCITSFNDPGSMTNDVSRLPNTRGNGSTVVNDRTIEQSFSATGTFKTYEGLNKSLPEIVDEYKSAFADGGRYFRVTRQHQIVGDFSIDSGVSLGGDATNEQFVTNNFQYGNQSLSFDYDTTSISGAYITKEFDVVDLSDYEDIGCFEWWMNFPDAKYIMGMDLLVYGGTGAEIWYSYNPDDLETDISVRSQYDGSDISSGWNYFSVAWENMTGSDELLSPTSAPDPSDIQKVTINLYIDPDTPADIEGILVNGVLWQNDNSSRNYISFIDSLKLSGNHYDVSTIGFTASFLNTTGMGLSTINKTVYEEETVTDTVHDFAIELGGTGDQEPLFQMDFDGATSINGFTLDNLTTGASVDFDASPAVNDVIYIDVGGKTIKENTEQLDYEYTIPNFLPGKNELRLTSKNTSLQEIDYLDGTAKLVSNQTIKLAQTFQAPATGILTDIFLDARLLGTGGTVTVGLYSSSGITNVGSTLLTTLLKRTVSNQNSGGVSTQVIKNSFRATPNYSVTNGSYYAIVMSSTNSLTGIASPEWKSDVTNPYANGSAMRRYSGGSWAAISGSDFNFRANIQPLVTIDYDLTVTNKNKYY